MIPAESSQKTRKTIVETAESLFAERGIRASSVRDIARLARVNLAAINYHFGGKDALVVAVFTQYIEPLNRECLRHLDRIEQALTERPVSLEEILSAYFEPIVTLHFKDGDATTPTPLFRLVSRCFVEPDTRLQSSLMPYFDGVCKRLCQLIGSVLPGLEPCEIYWRTVFCIGAFNQALNAWTRADPEQCTKWGFKAEQTALNLDGLMKQLTAFAADGFRSSMHKKLPKDG